MRPIKIVCGFGLLIFCLFAGCKNEPAHQETAHHAAEQEAVYTLPEQDHGSLQSPVNILTSATVSGKHAVTFNFANVEANAVANTGHSVQLNFPAGSSIAYDGQTFQFKQAHFHTPAEHLLDGVTYPMEMHLVHVKETSGETPAYLVIGVLFKMGGESKFIAEFSDAIPSGKGEQPVAAKQVMLTDLFGVTMPEEQSFYFYHGSLTTPPYTESVNWLVHEKIFEASPAQIQNINSIEGNNARHVQSLQGRQIEE